MNPAMRKILDCLESPRLRDFFLRRRSQRTADIKAKGDGTLVSASGDLAIDQIVADELRGTGIPVHSEETLGSVWPPPDSTYWLVDPLDGTHNEALGLPAFGTMVMYVENKKPRAAGTFLPAFDTYYWVTEGEGAYRSSSRSRVQRIQVSGTARLRDAMIFFEGPPKIWIEDKASAELVRRSTDMRQPGGTCWAGALVAAGGLEPKGPDALVAFGNKPWDNLPVFLMVHEAGGTVTDFKGNPWNFE